MDTVMNIRIQVLLKAGNFLTRYLTVKFLKLLSSTELMTQLKYNWSPCEMDLAVNPERYIRVVSHREITDIEEEWPD
jgi:hypothetical protein